MQNYQNVIDVFKHQRSLNLPLTVTGDGSQTRDFTHIRDIVNGLILSSKQLKNKEYFLGTGIEYSILDIAKFFQSSYRIYRSKTRRSKK